MTEEREYLLGTDREELQRLGFQHRVWAAETRALWGHAGFAPGQRLLDLGCGPGFASVDLGYIVGDDGEVVAIDRSARFIEHLRATARAEQLHQVHAQTLEVDALDQLTGPFDGAYARWLLCFVRDPRRVIHDTAALLRPGGTFAVLDYFRYEFLTLRPHSPALARSVEAVMQSWRESGGDLDVGGRLAEYFEEAGLEVQHVAPVARVARPGTLLWRWPRTFFFGFGRKLVAGGYLSAAEQEQLEEEWRQREQQPGALFFTPPMVEIVGRKR